VWFSHEQSASHVRTHWHLACSPPDCATDHGPRTKRRSTERRLREEALANKSPDSAVSPCGFERMAVRAGNDTSDCLHSGAM
jgi:hypothetical protein